MFCEKISHEVPSTKKLLDKINEILAATHSIILTKSDIDALRNIPTDINPFTINENCKIYRSLNKTTKRVISKISRQISKRKLSKEKEEEIKKLIKEYEQTRSGSFSIEILKNSNSNNPYGEKILLRTGYYCSKPDYLAFELLIVRKADPSDMRYVCKKLGLYVYKPNDFIQKNEYPIYFMLKLNNENNTGKNGKNNK